MTHGDADADRLIDEAVGQPFSGWDFSWLKGRMESDPLPWDFASIVRKGIGSARSMLDLGTGCGEYLAALAPLPPRAVATESYIPNVGVAQSRLSPFGASVVLVAPAPDNADQDIHATAPSLPFKSGTFELVTCRHESFVASEVARILRHDGVFLSQQTGPRNDDDFHRFFDLPVPPPPDPEWDLRLAKRQLEAAGLYVTSSAEATIQTTYRDVGALVYYLKAIPWVLPQFDVETFRDKLRQLHLRSLVHGGLRVRQRRFWWSARRVRPRSGPS